MDKSRCLLRNGIDTTRRGRSLVRLLSCSLLLAAALFPPMSSHASAGTPQQETKTGGGDRGPLTIPSKRAAIVIDDTGNNMKGTAEMLKLPFKITFAVMPFLSTTKADAEAAYQAGHDVIVHLPMEPKTGRSSWLGPGAITTDLSEEEIRKRVMAAIDDVPHASGINNHMGSKVTGDPRVVRIVLEVCKERGIFFLDSHTNYRSVVSKVAKEVGVPSLDNHLFLDDVKTKNHMAKQLGLVEDHLREHEPCIAIGHVGAGGEKLAEVLRERIPAMMASHNVRFVGIRELFAEQASTIVKVPRPSGEEPPNEAAASRTAQVSPLLESALLHSFQQEMRIRLSAKYGEQYVQYDCQRITDIRKLTNPGGGTDYELTVRLRKRSGTVPLLVKLVFRSSGTQYRVVSMTDEPLPPSFTCS